MAITKQKGDIAEAFVMYLLKTQGFNVLIPWGEDTRYDIVSEKNGIFKRIQVKYVSSNNGVLDVAIRSSNNYNVKPYTSSEIDIIAAFCPLLNKVYFLPLNIIKNRRSLKLRLQQSRNQQKKNVVMAVQYESRFDLLER
ncbi:MAG: hypothetical protein C4540_06110 [Candidatus Omnitrophota bacterium]|jgi:hypothetical protein|nr:MAG: hypothetical protein C4540_06110 [Candidatus Omnitrophota bacterium]